MLWGLYKLRHTVVKLDGKLFPGQQPSIFFLKNLLSVNEAIPLSSSEYFVLTFPTSQ